MLFLAADHAGFQLAQTLLAFWCNSLNHSSLDILAENQAIKFLNPALDPGDDYPDVATLLANNLATASKSLNSKILSNNQLEIPRNFGLAICGTGQGICMALNRFKHIRAGCLNLSGLENLTESLEIIKLLRQHNNANVLCLSRSIAPQLAVKLFQTFIETQFSQEPRHIRRVDKLSRLVN